MPIGAMKQNSRPSLNRLLELGIFALYIFFVVLLTPSNLSFKQMILFYGYSLIIYWLSKFSISRAGKLSFSHSKNKYFFIFVLIVAFGVLIFSRLFPFWRDGDAALGYDVGFYLAEIQRSALFEHKIGYFLAVDIFRSIGFSAKTAFYFLYFISQILIFAGIYAVLQSLRPTNNRGPAAIGAFLFSISIIQFLGYWSALGQQMLATGFLLLTIALVLRHSPFFLLTAAMTLLTHTPTFFILAIFFVFFVGSFFVKNKCERLKFNRRFLLALAVIICCAFLFVYLKFDKISGEIETLMQRGIWLKNYPFWKHLEMSGLFIPINQFHFFSLVLLPFALSGMLSLFVSDRINRKKEISAMLPIYLLTLALCAISLLPVVYQGRFSIVFDLFLLIFASWPIYHIAIQFIGEFSGKVCLIIFFAILLTCSLKFVNHHEALISREEVDKIKTFSQVLESQAIIMTTTSTYTPWIYGFSKREIIGPGHLYDKWSLTEWLEFWHGTDYDAKYQLLLRRPSPLYIYIGNRQTQRWAFQDYIESDNHFQKIAPGLWKFVETL